VSDEPLFVEGGVTVTKTRFVTREETYAMSGITSVASRRDDPNRVSPIMVIVLGIILIIGGLGESGLMVAGVIIAALGVVWYRSLKTKFVIVLRTPGGEVKALESRNERWVENVLKALNDAIIARG